MLFIKDLINESRNNFYGSLRPSPSDCKLEGLRLFEYNDELGAPASVLFDDNGYLDYSLLKCLGIQYFTPKFSSEFKLSYTGPYWSYSPAWVVDEAFDTSFFDVFDFTLPEKNLAWNTNPKIQGVLISYMTKSGSRLEVAPSKWLSIVTKDKRRCEIFEDRIFSIQMKYRGSYYGRSL